MKFDVTVNVDAVVHIHQCDGNAIALPLTRIESKLDSVDLKLETLMALVDDLKEAVAELNVATNECSARIDILLARLASDSLTPAQKTEIIGALKAESDRLKTLAADPAVPVPPVPEVLSAARRR